MILEVPKKPLGRPLLLGDIDAEIQNIYWRQDCVAVLLTQQLL